ncbi:MAG TPA: hypothetical protein VHJ34_13335 [Actinomycetota bacterium]|nr:hypothetical protein [Actinomycetota bacterium]
MADDDAIRVTRTDAEGDPRLKLVYDEAIRAASLMSGVHDGLRQRAATLVSATGIATSFLGGVALIPGNVSVWAWIALAAFVGSAVFAVLVLRERPLRVAFSANVLLDHYVYAQRPKTLDEMHRELAQYLDLGINESERRIRSQFIQFYVAAALLVVELLAWVAALALRE